jgi:hypothetical protein
MTTGLPEPENQELSAKPEEVCTVAGLFRLLEYCALRIVPAYSLIRLYLLANMANLC